MKPVIGILTCGYTQKRQFVTDTYIRCIRIAGGTPFLIPALPPKTDITPYLSTCDGFLLPGGNDITPLLQEENPVPGIGPTNLSFDAFQIHFAEKVLSGHKPVFGICRGMQIINAAQGGTVYQDISLQPGNPFLHMQTSESHSDVSHKVLIKKDSLLYPITGDMVYTNSYHHQSVQKLGEHITACAHTEDGTVEAIEISGHPFALGVQWHPEMMFFSSVCMRNLFSLFIKSCLTLNPTEDIVSEQGSC